MVRRRILEYFSMNFVRSLRGLLLRRGAGRSGGWQKGPGAALAVVAVGTLAMVPGAHGQTVGLLREVWENVGGASVSDLTGWPDYPSRPTSSNYVTDLFESPTDVLENYGQRMHGYLVAPLTGSYTFWLATDDGGALYLSTDENPANAREIATVNGWTSPREWEREPNQRSSPIPLTAGRAYYVSALMKEQGGGDNLAVRWVMPNGVDQAPIVGTNLLPWGVSFAPPAIAEQPANASVVEGGTARFAVRLAAPGPAGYQWRRNGSPLAGATQPELVYGPVPMSDHGARFGVVVTNKQGSATSREATLTVLPDTTPPALVKVENVGTTLLRIRFSEAVSPGTATNAANYAIASGPTVTGARIGAEASVVELTVGGLVYGTAYTLRVSGVQDRAQTPNTLAPNSTLNFTAFEYAPAPVGEPPVAGSVTAVGGGVDVAGGGDIGGRWDAFQFAYQPVTGNFDRRVRVESFAPTDPFAQAGLMARPTLETNAPFAAALVTPAQLGAFFLARASAGSDAVRSGAYPPNFPEMWLRLARSGNTFRGYASLDGRGWTELGSSTVAMPATVFLGFAAAGRDSGVAATAKFREAGDVTGATVAAAPGRRGETLGPSSRLTPLVISEIHYHPREREDGRNAEFVEIYNADLIDQDLTGHRISGSVDFAFPEGYVLPAGGFAVVARNPADVATLYGASGVLGPFAATNNLPNDSGTVRLRNPQGAVLLEVVYESGGAWPVAADGAGPSLVLARPSYGEGDPRAWAASEEVGGSPGAMEARRSNPQAGIVLNEVLAHTDLPQLDFVELHNPGAAPVDLGGCVITDDPITNRFRIPAGTVISPRGHVVFDETRLGFRLDAAGETVFLISSNLTRVLDAVRFGPQENGVAFGRTPDGALDWRRLREPTAGFENATYVVSDVVINEILYAPVTGDDDDEFVELHNRGSVPVDLGGWSFGDGIDFRFPAGTAMPAGAYFVVAKNRDRLLSRNPGLAPGVVFGGYGGTLSNGGERLALARPDLILSTNEFGLTETNRIDIDVDEVTYGTGGRWGQWSDGLGSSLELVDPHSDHLRPSNWADSDESGEAPWTTIEFTGRVDNVADGVSTSRLHLLAQGPGEYLVDDVEVIGAGATNRLANGSFTQGLTGWTVQGNHRASALSETEGLGGSRALRISATGRGDTAVNRVRAAIGPSLAANTTATLRARVRWLRGWPEFLLRTLGSGLEAYGRLELPRSLGTPGARNSRAVANAGPAIFDVRHTPPVPRGGEAVVVSARVSDPDGVPSVNLRYRSDPGTTLTTLAMRDDGTGGDAVGGDGWYSATLPGRTANSLVAFRVEATDGGAGPAAGLFPPDAPRTEALIRWGEEKPFGNLGLYRFWQREADYNRLRAREPLANDNVDCTFVYGDERVIYNAGMRGKGSPWHGGSVGGDYIFAMPEGDRLLGAQDVAVVTLGNLGSDGSAQREQAAFWIGRQLGVPTLHRRHVQFFENGGFKGLYEDTEEPNGLYVDRWFPEGEDGDLFKIEDWFEFNDAGNNFVFARDATLQRFTTAGGDLKLARYRWAWRRRAVVESANDYGAFFRLVQAVNAGDAALATQVESQVDVENWMRLFALQHIVGNWDAYGHGRGKNSYLYLPRNGRWQVIPWDIDFVLGSGSDGPTTDVFGSVDPMISRLWETPVFRRMYWRAFQDAVAGPLREEAIGPVLDGRYAALVANGFSGIERTAPIKAYVNQRRQYLASRSQSEDVAALEIGTRGGADFATNRNLVTLTGSAPIAVATLEVNGLPFPPIWTSVNTWSLSIPLAAPTNVLRIVGYDLRGRPVPGASDTVTVRYTGVPPDPADFLVLNEIMFDPPRAGASFVEIRNTSPTGAFDLSGWRLDGVGYVFPEGTLIRPGAYLVVAGNLAGFRAAYGVTVVPVGEFPGTLQNGGERLRLVRPGTTPESDRVIDEVRYDGEPPWPMATRGGGPSLQLLDALQDNRRVANWGATPTNSTALASPGAANGLATSLEPFPALWLNEVVPQNPAGRTDAAGERDPWVELINAGTNTVDLSGLFLASTYTNLTEWAFPAGTRLGPGQFLVVWCDGQPGQSTLLEPHTSFRLGTTNGSLALVRLQSGAPAVLDYLDWRGLPAGRAWGSYPDAAPLDRRLFHLPTPGSANNPGAPALSVFVNEWMASNTGAVADPADGDPDDWFELYNAGSTPADLSAFTLSDDLANPAKARIPNGTVVPPGGFLTVWADEEPGQTSPGQLHVGFKLSGAGEALGLFAPDGVPVDALSFGIQADNRTQGRFPDGGPEPFAALTVPTPGAPNLLASANQPPVLDPIGEVTVDEGAVARFTARATDADAGQVLRYSLLGAPAGAAIDPVTGAFAWTTGEADGPGLHPFTVRVTDSGTPPRFANRPVTVAVREINQAPALDPIEDRAVDEGSTLVFVVRATDADRPVQRLTFGLEPGAPAGAVVHPQTGEFAWKPLEAQGPAVHAVGVRVTDDGTPPLSAVRSLRVTVNEVDNPPEFDPVGLQSADEGVPFAVTLVARDPDEPPRAMVYALESGPSGATLDAGSGEFRWTPGEAAGPGSYPVIARASQAGGGPSSTLSFSISVNERNEAPELASIPDYDVPEGTLILFTAVGTDTDLPAQRLTYTLEPGAPFGAAIEPQTGSFTWNIPPDAGASTNRIIVVVTDNALEARSASRAFTVIVRPRLRVVIHEIMYAPATARTEFVELSNFSTATGWNLAGWRLTGLEFVFPDGTVLGPTNHLVIARDVAAFRAAYGSSARVIGDANLGFPPIGPMEVRLERPGSAGWEIVDRVSFLRTAPWPLAAAGGGASLQLRDATQDNRRVANWAALAGATTNAPRAVVAMTNTWRYQQDGPAPADWKTTAFADASWPSGRGLLYVEDAALPAPKNTALVRTEGRMTYYFRTRFAFDGNPEGAALVVSTVCDDGYVLHLNGREIHRLGMDATAAVGDSTAAARTVGDAVLEGPFTIPVTNLVAGDNVLAVEVHQVNATSSDLVWGASVEVLEVKREPATPGYANNVRLSLPPFPDVWINEVLPRNTTGLADNAGEREPWIELANAGVDPADLGGWYLTDDFANLTRWRLPQPGPLPAGSFRLVWADAETAESTATDWHANFRLPSPQGSVALVRDQPGGPAVVDFVNFEVTGVDESFGILQPADPLTRGRLPTPTPGAANGANRPPTLDPIADQTTELASQLVVTVVGRDPDAAQHLSYRLGSGAPDGAVIEAATGRFTWTPGPGQEGTHTVSVRVRDDGVPPPRDRRVLPRHRPAGGGRRGPVYRGRTCRRRAASAGLVDRFRPPLQLAGGAAAGR
jgi:hypothetical protein